MPRHTSSSPSSPTTTADRFAAVRETLVEALAHALVDAWKRDHPTSALHYRQS